jgi:hypothetical protein
VAATLEERKRLSELRPNLISAQGTTPLGLKILGVILAIVNGVLWFCVPAIRSWLNALTGNRQLGDNPHFTNGVQELLVYYDPWLARGVFPVVYSIGFVAITFLYKSTPNPSRPRVALGTGVVAMLLLGFEAVWIFLIAMAMFFRGPDWNFYWPWEEWTPKLIPLNNVNLSDVFWFRVSHAVPERSWLLREAPGLFFLASYLLIGLMIAYAVRRGRGYAIGYWCFILLMTCLVGVFTSPLISALVIDLILVFFVTYFMSSTQTRSSMGYWRCALLVLLVQLAALVPLKIALRSVLNLKYFIFIPEHFVNV